MTSPNGTNPLAERELELSLWEAELNRREEALRQLASSEGPPAADVQERMAALERTERDLQRALEAVESQRAQLDSVRAEYESRRDALKARTLEVEAELDRLRTEQNDRVATSLEQPRRLGSPLEAA